MTQANGVASPKENATSLEQRRRSSTAHRHDHDDEIFASAYFEPR